MAKFFGKYDCKISGCFKDKYMPVWDFLDDAFPGRIRPSDVDGVVERNGCLLLLEFKTTGKQLETGQKILHSKATKKNPFVTSMVVWGDPKTMIVTGYATFHGGNYVECLGVGNQEVFDKCKTWYEWADNQC